jgi:hypothetical protein
MGLYSELIRKLDGNQSTRIARRMCLNIEVVKEVFHESESLETNYHSSDKRMKI